MCGCSAMTLWENYYSKTHSAVISSGVELENLILSRVQQIEDLDEFIDAKAMPKGVFVATQKGD